MIWLAFACSTTPTVVSPVLALDTDTVELVADAGGFATAAVTVENGGEAGASLVLGEEAGDVGIETTLAEACVHWTTPACATVVEAAAGDAELCADGAPAGGDRLALPVGCALPVTLTWAPTTPGAAIGAVRVRSERAADGGTGGDPAEPTAEVVVTGTATAARAGRLVLDPPELTSTWRWPDGVATELALTWSNPGDTDVTVGAADLGCSPAWEVVGAPTAGSVLAAGASVSLTVQHTPYDPDPEVCTLRFGADGGVASASSAFRFVPDTWSQPPTVELLAPEPGAEFAEGEKLTLHFALADDQAPASGIFITIWSAAQRLTLAQGVAPDDDGVVEYDIGADELIAGPETFRVSALDWEFFTEFDAVPVRIGAPAAVDGDGDRWGPDEGDCDDDDADVYPGAHEDLDGVDDDCDGTVDDGAPEADNDRDGTTEAEGDCNDHDSAVGPGAPELANQADDDCDGEADEGTTRRDDDGDGYSELVGDCDDADDTVHPAAWDVCDGVDRDCDGVYTACETTTTGAVAAASPDVCAPGATVVLTATLPAGAVAAWTADGGELDDAAAATTTLRCGDEAGTVYVSLASTLDGATTFDVLRIDVVEADPGGAGCAGTGAGAVLGICLATAVRGRRPR